MANVLTKALKEIGLSDFAVSTYIRLTELENPGITNLAASMSVDRVKIYKALTELEESNLIQTRTSYARGIELLPPNILLQKLKQKELLAKNISLELVDALPDLNFQFYNQKRSPIVKIYEGKTQFINLYEQILEEAIGTIKVFGNTAAVYELISFDYQMTWTKRRMIKNIHTQLLVSYDFKLDQYDKQVFPNGMREVRWLPDKDRSFGNYWLYNKKCIHWNPVYPKAIVIDDSTIVENMHYSFELLWELFENNKARKV